MDQKISHELECQHCESNQAQVGLVSLAGSLDSEKRTVIVESKAKVKSENKIKQSEKIVTDLDVLPVRTTVGV